MTTSERRVGWPDVVDDPALREALTAACHASGVPGASLAVLEGSFIRTATAGMANSATGEPVTPTTRFPLGSVGKPYTAMLVLQLEAEGRLSLDDPVRRYLPDLHLGPGSDRSADAITVRHLLANTSGLPGYHAPGIGSVPSVGGDDDVLERYLGVLEEVGIELVHAPGERFSYSNPGFVLAGLIAERLLGAPWDVVLEERLLRPLGLHETGTRPDQLGDAPVAAAHLPEPDGGVTAVPWAGPWSGVGRGNGPAGVSYFATASDLARFGAAHLDPKWRVMREPQVTMPGPHVEAWGLGWAVYGWGAAVAGWNGVITGYRSFLLVLPEHRAAVALLTNANEGRRIYRTLLRGLLAERFGVEMAPERPEALADGERAPELEQFAGEWRCARMVVTITPADDGRGLILRNTFRMGTGSMQDGTRLLPTRTPGLFVLEPRDADFPVVVFDGDVANISGFGFRRRS